MFDEFFVPFVENVAKGIELVSVIGIALVFIYALIGSILSLTKRDHTLYNKYKVMIAKVLQTGLEFLIAADIIRTVIVEPTLQATFTLGMLVLVRTFLSWTLTLETEGRWPWQKNGSLAESKSSAE